MPKPPIPIPGGGPSPEPKHPDPHALHGRKRHLGTAPAIILSIFAGTLIALIVAFVINYFHVAWEIILPVLAPIWVGSITLVYTILKDR